MRIAQIINNEVHWIFEAKSIPNWPPDPEGNPTVLVDITDHPEVEENWLYDGKNFIKPEIVVLPVIEIPIPEPTQLDRIEAKIDKSQQDIIDEYTLSLIEEGIL